jgi:phenylalanyl-tRNA synthetase alpha chain
MFHQLECLVVDEKSSIVDLRACLETFFRLFFQSKDVPLRFRTSYFPFTEPSFEVDIKCDRSKKGEIKIGTGNDWLEILGCGMINKKVLNNVGMNCKKYQGFAFGVGIERLAMLKYNIADLRSFFDADVRWLKHYGF